MKTPRVGVISLGCSKNLVDTEVMLGHLDAAGFAFVQDPDEADVLVVNTCGFIDAAREESVRTILEAARRKEDGSLKRLVVAGCMVQRYREELHRELAGEVDAFVGLDELSGIVEAARGVASAAARSDVPLLQVYSRQSTVHSSQSTVHSSQSTVHSRAVDSQLSTVNFPTTSTPSRYLYSSRTPRKLATPPWTAFVKIAEGCDHSCAFCAIPAFRGAFRSRAAEDVVAEVSDLARRGVREVNLIAQDSSHFGRDRQDSGGLAGLLVRLNEVEDLRWIRVHYLYPNTVDDRLIEAMARLPRVAHYVDIPLQHAHPDTLRRMRRGGGAESHLALLKRFREAMPDAALRSTMIVGFPGETEREFDALAAFVAEARLDHLGVFTYSHEDATPAERLDDDVPGAVKEERRARLMETQQRVAFRKNAARVGSDLDVLVEGSHPDTDDLLVGRAWFQAPDVDGQVLINDGFVVDASGGDPRLVPHARPGAFARVAITETAGYDLVGRVVGAA